MKKIVTYVLLAVIGIAMVGGIGCATVSDLITPATLDPQAKKYTVKAGVADMNDYAGYANLCKARMLEVNVKSAHEVNTLYYAQLLDKEALDFGILNGVVERNRQKAMALEDSIFNPTTGLLAMGLGFLGLGGGGVIGLMRKRPGDWEPAEVQDALVDLNVEVGDKERQFIETVKGVQDFINEHGESDAVIVGSLKSWLTSTQSADTKQAVAVAKMA